MGLEVKLGALVLLLVLTLICSLVPVCVLRRLGSLTLKPHVASPFPCSMMLGLGEVPGVKEVDLRGTARVTIALIG